ncbi:Vitamin B12 import ATP-binding protein BtuD [Candidatus Lokiarchaeum ossiferum]|uniref:Vitamin B12 import ATP-binding protein BtuD n=1 Tax=Candidatus Lokiarchaeum ossiferum TaxID=2951803 RepID=A0ABY6HWG8_9ARCH|nr:Vitamin B12 import ATP-binding protein BtuD [Candidatus Lokiarchaeum sp. B-35]
MVIKKPISKTDDISTINTPYKILVEGVHKTYLLGATAVPALRGIDLKIKPGEFTGLMGPSGCGKTTLLNLIGGLDYPTRGKIYLDGQDMSRLNENQLADLRRDKIGYVFQFYNLLPLLSALENVMIPLHFQGTLSKRARKRKAMELLKLVKLDERAHHTPSELSGGEQQRVAIARAFANDPSIVMLDEPTGDLDSKTGIEILNLLRDLNRKGATFIAATHDAAVSEYCTRIVHIRDGKIVKGLEVSGLKETEEMRSARLDLQAKYKEKCEVEILKTVRESIKDHNYEIRFSKIREQINPDIISNLPLHFDDLMAELVEKEDIKGKINSGVLYISKERSNLDD